MIGEGGHGSRPRQPDASLRDQLTAIADGSEAGLPETLDAQSLAAGLRFGLERPDAARRLLAQLEGDDRDADADRREDVDASTTAAVSATSMLLVRSAAMSSADRAEVGPAVVFGWAARLTSAEILAMGRVVMRQLDAGAPPDIERGLGLAWDAGVRIPLSEREAMLGEFSQLQRVVGSVLAGHDLGDEPAPRETGIGALLGQLLSRSDPAGSRVAAAIDAHGDAGRRGLVALWNGWVALRYRSALPESTFELLTRAWTEVMGPLPGA